MEKNLTTGSVFGNIVRFSLPYLLSYFLQTLYGMADLFIIGQYEGVASTTAVSIGSQVMHMLTVMIVGLAMGADGHDRSGRRRARPPGRGGLHRQHDDAVSGAERRGDGGAAGARAADRGGHVHAGRGRARARSPTCASAFSACR